MPISCFDCPLRKNDCFIDMSDDEVRFMDRFKVGELKIEPKTTFLMEGSSSPQMFTVLKGMGLRYKLLPNGRRQVLNFIYPGDFVGLQAGLISEMRHSAEATTQMTLCVFDRREIWSLFKYHPGRAFQLTWLTAIEEHFLGSTISTIGQRDARERVAWAMVHIYHRARLVGLVDGRTTEFPFKQQDFADALGLSLVHTNKTLARFREDNIVNWSGGKLDYIDLDRLSEIGMTDESEHFERRPLI